MLGFTQAQADRLSDTPRRFIQKLPGAYKNGKPISIISIDKTHIKCDCINGSIGKGLQDPILYSFAPEKPPGYKTYNQLRIKLPKKKKQGCFVSCNIFFSR